MNRSDVPYSPLDAAPSTSDRDYKLKQRPTTARDVVPLKRSNSLSYKTVLGSELPQGIRQRDKFVPLPLDSSRGASPGRVEEEAALNEIAAVAPGASGRARITVYCVAESLDRRKLVDLLRIKHPAWQTHQYDDVVHARLEEVAPALPSTSGGAGAFTAATAVGPPDVFFFDYGVVAFWGLQQQQEAEILRSLVRAVESRPLERYDVDAFTFNISVSEPPHIQNDTITINRRQATDHQVRLAMSHALAQSTKLSVYEERGVARVEESRHLPQVLAQHGRVSMSTKKLAQLIGKVFLQSSDLNLLSTVMDTPEFFWSAPDQLQALYERACEYLELDTRAEVLNARFQVLQEMLDMLRDHKNNSHAARLEWIIIWLLMVDVILMLFQLLSLFGLV
ncbi:sporulation protein rmd1 [Pleodorina starrii]|nr:sporulation protein rmd1 [Pleodorina starrii]